MSTEQLEQVAKRLGHKTLQVWEIRSGYIADYVPLGMGEYEGCHYSDGDLLLAILNRAAEMGYERGVYDRDTAGYIRCSFHKRNALKHFWGISRDGNEMEAAILAFIQLPHDP